MKKKSLYDIALEKGFKTLKEVYDYADGKKVVTGPPSNKGTASGHNYAKSFKFHKSVYQENMNISVTTALAYLLDGKSNGGGIFLTELYIDTITKEELENNLKVINERFAVDVESIKSKLTIMEELGIEEYEGKTLTVLIALDKYKNVKPEERLGIAQDLIKLLK